jgi:hypothetical protein
MKGTAGEDILNHTIRYFTGALVFLEYYANLRTLADFISVLSFHWIGPLIQSNSFL